MHTLILVLATVPPVDSPSLKPGLDPDQVSPGFLGFLVTFGVVAIMFFLIRDMVKRIRRVRYRAQVLEQSGAQQPGMADDGDDGEGAAEGDGSPEGSGAEARAAQRRPGHPRAGGSHGPDAEFLEPGRRDDGPAGPA